MPDAARTVSGIPRAHPGGRVIPRFWHRLNRFRHFCGGSLALASLDRACRNPVPAFPQRSPPRLLTAAACGGLRSAPDCRTRRALLHLSYSCAPPILTSALVTHDPKRSLAFDHQVPNHAIDSPCGPVHATVLPLIASRKRPRCGMGGAALAKSGNTLGTSLLIQTALDRRIACANCSR
jgi:hypothetical protein